MDMKRKFLYGVLAAAGCLLNSCSDRQHDFDACGQIEATEVVVSAEANGRIVALNLTEGDELEAGHQVGVIDSVQLYLQKKELVRKMSNTRTKLVDVDRQLASQYAHLKNLRTDYARYQALAAKDAATRKQVDDLVSQIAVAEREISAKKQTFERNNAGIREELALYEVQIAEKEDQPRADKEDQSGEKDEDSAAFQSLTAADRREIHEKKYKKRFMPQDFDFSSENSSLQKYLSSLTDERIQKLEKLRVKLLSGVKPNLLATFERNPYTGRIKLKRSSTNGTIALANENTLIIRRGRNSRRRNQVSWTDLAPEQIFTFLEYYGDMRMKLSDGTVSAKERKEHAANQYLVAAILADWYGEYDDALRLARKAYRANPEIQKKTEVLFLE